MAPLVEYCLTQQYNDKQYSLPYQYTHIIRYISHKCYICHCASIIRLTVSIYSSAITPPSELDWRSLDKVIYCSSLYNPQIRWRAGPRKPLVCSRTIVLLPGPTHTLPAKVQKLPQASEASNYTRQVQGRARGGVTSHEHEKKAVKSIR